MERQVTVPLEVTLAGMPSLKTVHSRSLFGLTHLRCIFHYDFPYVTGTEGYPGLVVHGPLLATLLLDLLLRQRPDARLTRFEFRAVGPLFDNAPFSVCARPAGDGGNIALWAKGSDGRLAMDAVATVA